MGQVTSLFARKLADVAGDAIDTRAVLASVGLDMDAPWNPKHMLDEDDFYGMIEMMARQMDVTALPVIVGQAMRPDEYGALGLAWKAAPNLLGSFSRVARYWRLWTSSTRYALEETDEGFLFIEHRAGIRRLGLRLSVEADLASGVSLGRQVSPRPFAPLEVYFQHHAPITTEHHEAFFGCPVRFAADKDAMLLSRQSLSEPNLLGDAGITQFLVAHLEQELAQVSDPPALQVRTKNEIARALSEGLPRMADIARQLGLSARSFHRRLADQGLSFQTLTEETRREIATSMLKEKRYSLSEIAFLTGYSEQSAFNRAFKRWMGMTPAAYRNAIK